MSENKPVLLGTWRPSGYQFWNLLKRRMPDITYEEFDKAFERYIILYDDCAYRGRDVLVLGNVTRQLLHLPPLLIHPQEKDGTVWRQIPCPTSYHEWYDNPTNQDLVSLILESLYVKWRESNASGECPKCVCSTATHD